MSDISSNEHRVRENTQTMDAVIGTLVLEVYLESVALISILIMLESLQTYAIFDIMLRSVAMVSNFSLLMQTVRTPAWQSPHFKFA